MSDANLRMWNASNSHRVFTATSTGGGRQPITTRPESGVYPYDPEGLLIYVGTGKYLTSEDATATSPTQSIYALWDKPYTVSSTIPRTDLVRQRVLAAVGNQRVTSKEALDWTSHQGWYMAFAWGGRTRRGAPGVVQ